MSMTTSIVSQSHTLHHVNPCNRSHQAFFFNPIGQLGISKYKDGFLFPANRSLRYLSNGNRIQSDNKSKMDFAVYSTDQPGDLISLGPFLDPWKGWIFGGLVTIILPFLTNKWGPLLKWGNEVEAAAEKIEDMAEAVENVAEAVDKMAEDLAENLPVGGKLRNAVTIVEKMAEEVVKDANKLEEVLDKVEEVENKLESMIQGEEDKSNEAAKVANDQK